MSVLQLNSARRWVVVLAAAFVSLSLFSGCGEKEKPASDDSSAKLEQSQSDTPKTTSVPSEQASDGSPADSTLKLPSIDAMPDQVCHRFMKFLQSGNRMTAEQLLTRTAFTVTSQADWQIPPVGGNEAKFKMGTVRYATNKMKLAQADCEVIDLVDGKKEISEITWMLRKKDEGWRIFGMLVQLYEDKPKDLISFENPSDVAMIKATLDSQQANSETETSEEVSPSEISKADPTVNPSW